MVTGESLRAGRREGVETERGQVVVLTALLLVVLLGMAALVIDVGYAYYAHRSLQASADAAALAGAQELPDGNVAAAVAKQYSASAGSKNELGNLGGVTTTVTTKCISTIPGCDPMNAVVVVEGAPAKSFFAGLFGIDSFKVKATSIACSPCGLLPLDIMMVLDRTGSMCLDSNGNNDPACTDLKNARDGMKTFLGFLDPTTQWVGLAVLPPVPTGGDGCTAPAHHSTTASKTTAYRTTSAYKIVPLSDDYSENGALVSSPLVDTINCQQAAGWTGYANALEAAQTELELVDADPTTDREDAKNVIVFLSDGAANMGPSDLALSNSYRRQPCRQGVNSAAAIKLKGTLIYSIGYDLNALGGGANVCQYQSANGAAPSPLETPPITAYSALQQIATTPSGPNSTFYNQPTAGELKTIFTQVAADLQRGTAALIDG